MRGIARLGSAALLGLVFAVACGADEPGQPGYDTQIDAPTVAGGTGPRYAVPIPIVPGDAWPAGFDFQAANDRATQAQLSQGTPRRVTVAGIELIPFAQANGDNARKKCTVASFEEAEHFQFAYLPAGTSALTPQFEALCPDGSVNFISQEFSTTHGGFIQVQFGLRPADGRYLVYDAPPERTHQGDVDGDAALIVDPPVPEGIGPSLVAYQTPRGFVLIQANNVPPDEINRVVEGLKCGDC